MRYLVLIAFLLTKCHAFAQPIFYKNQVMITSENDAYLFAKNDGYYTNGLFVKFSAAKEKSKQKIINSYELGQMIFTPRTVNFYRNGEGIDRPFCGYLFATYNRSIFLPKQQVLQWAVTLGTIGQNSLGQNVQEAIHTTFHYKKFTGWDTQINNEIGLNGKLQYARAIEPFKKHNNFKIIPEAEINFGNTFINAQLGGYLCFGMMENNENSALFDAKISSTKQVLKHKSELLFYWHPILMWQGYNATVQGGIFTKNDDAITAGTTPLMYLQSVGVLYASNRLTTKLEINYQTREADTQIATQQYGSIGIAYRFN